MKIKRLIKELQTVLEQSGNIDVKIWDEALGDNANVKGLRTFSSFSNGKHRAYVLLDTFKGWTKDNIVI